MTTYESKVKAVTATDEQIFRVLSNMNNLSALKSRIPQDKVQDFSTTAEQCSFKISPLGEFVVGITSKTPYNTIKYSGIKTPMAFDVWVQVKKLEDYKCALKVTLKADLNFMIKAMVGSKLEEAVDKMAEVLARLPYAQM